MGKMKRGVLLLVVLAVPLLISSVSLAEMEWITVAPQGHYFETESGRPFLVVGQNDAITWPYLSDLLLTGNPASSRQYLTEMKESGVNTIRIMFEYAQFPYGLAEDPLGDFRPEVVSFWDEFISLAEEFGIYLIITPWDPFWMEREWAYNPYNVSNGGMLASMKGFLVDPEAKRAQRHRLQFMVDRWGGSPAILAWELMNEIELWWGAGPHDIRAWITEMAEFVRQRQREVHGRDHLLTVSTATPFPDPMLIDAVLNHPSLDFATTHHYTGPAVNAPTNTVEAADDVAIATVYAKSQIPDGRPYLDTESGPITRWIADDDFDTEYYHNMTWAHLMSGGAGQGLRWPYRTPHVLSAGMRNIQSAFRRFIDAVDWTDFIPEIIGDYVEVRDREGNLLKNIQPFGIADERRVYLWLLNTSPKEGQPALPIVQPRLVVFWAQWLQDTGKELPNGEYSLQVEYWNTYNGTRVGTEQLASSRPLWDIPLPTFEKDLAVAIRIGVEP